MSAKSAKKKRSQQRAAAKRSKKPPRTKRLLPSRLKPREMTIDELQGAVESTVAAVTEKSGYNAEEVKAVVIAMIETGYVGISDDGTVAPLRPLPKKWVEGLAIPK